MLLHLVPLSAWLAAPEGPFAPALPGQDGLIPCCIDESSVVALANSLYQARADPLVALVIDESRLATAVGDGSFVRGPIERDAVREVRYVRRDPTGRYVTAERRPTLAEALDLLPHPEGGWYRETWASPVEVVPEGYEGSRVTATAIYFLLPPGEESCWHQLRSDEIWLWQRGGPLKLGLGGDGERPGEEVVITLGPNVESGHSLQALVPGGTWQTARPAGDEEVLVSTVVSPGFDFADFRAG